MKSGKAALLLGLQFAWREGGRKGEPGKLSLFRHHTESFSPETISHIPVEGIAVCVVEKDLIGL